jgi:hypothetical protein
MRFDDATLMAFHDGELDAETARRVELARLSDRDVALRLEALEKLGQFVRVWAAMRRAPPVPKAVPPARPQVRAGLALAAAFAVAAAVLLALPAPPLAVPGAPPVASAPLAVEVKVAPAVAVESVDFGAQHGKVFLIESARSETTVVWLAEAPVPSSTGTL